MTPYMKKWTCKDFQQAGDMGLFEGCMAILIRGVIWEHGQISPRKACAMVLASDAIRAVFKVNWVVRTQMPLSVFFDTDPVPNLCLIRGYPRDLKQHPTTAALVIEISDTSLRFDTTEKMSLYAAAGIPDYWVLDLNNNQLLVFRDPVPDATAAHGSTYRTSATYGPTESVAPLAEPNASIAVSDMLP